jgi:cation diffusion facilitator CzcD-associated flavoprotein CzcO
VVDRVGAVAQRLTVGDLSKHGMPPPTSGLYTRVLGDERIPILDVGLIGALKRGEVTVVPALERFEASAAVLAGGERLEPDAVIAATGFRRGLEGLLGDLDILDAKGSPRVHGDETHPDAPNLYFIGYSNPLSGNLRELGIDARRIAQAVAGGR